MLIRIAKNLTDISENLRPIKGRVYEVVETIAGKYRPNDNYRHVIEVKRPVASAKSSNCTPKEPATGATYFIVSPIISTFVLERVIVAANISTMSPQSVACIPIAVIVSVTISDVVPKSAEPICATILLSIGFLSHLLYHYSIVQRTLLCNC